MSYTPPYECRWCEEKPQFIYVTESMGHLEREHRIINLSVFDMPFFENFSYIVNRSIAEAGYVFPVNINEDPQNTTLMSAGMLAGSNYLAHQFQLLVHQLQDLQNSMQQFVTQGVRIGVATSLGLTVAKDEPSTETVSQNLTNLTLDSPVDE